MSKIFFYLSEFDYNRVKDLCRIEEFTLHHPQLVWVWSTYFRLKEKGYDVELTCAIPRKGIVVISAINIALMQKPPDDVLMICTVADTPPRFFSHVNISQNPLQFRDYPNLLRFPVWHHIPHWPQPNIIKRDKERKDKFENIAFLGHTDQCEPFLRSTDFSNELSSIGLRFEVRDQYFHDYSSVDCAIAIRSFSGKKYLYKPYTKVVNAWMGEVPVITGSESSFMAIKKTDLDFIAVENKGQLLDALQLLKENPSLREEMVENGKARALEFTEDSIVDAWEKFLFGDAQLYYEKWIRKSRIEKQLFYTDLFLSRSVRSVKNKIKTRLTNN